MAKTDLTAQRLRELLHYDPETGVFIRKTLRPGHPAGQLAGSTKRNGYVSIRFLKCDYLAHRLAWLYVYGQWPKDTIDHINRVRNDNRIANLREATYSQNHQNKTACARSKSGHKGVVQYGEKWRANICVRGNVMYLGQFQTLDEARSARLEAEMKHFTHAKTPA